MFVEFKGFATNSFCINPEHVTGVWITTDEATQKQYTCVETHNKYKFRCSESVTQVTQKLNCKQRIVRLEGRTCDSMAVDPTTVSHVFWSTVEGCVMICFKNSKLCAKAKTAEEVINKLWPELSAPEIEEKADEGRKLEV